MSKSNVLGIGFVLLVVGFILGHAVAPSPTEPPAPAPVVAPESERKPEQIFQPAEVRDPVLEILLDAVRELDAFDRLTRLAGVLPALGPDTIPEIRTVLDDAALDTGAPEIDLMLRWWAKSDPTGAANWAYLKANAVHKDAAVTAAIETWSEEDPRAAWAYVQTMAMAEAEATRAAEVAVVRGWYKSGEPGLIEFIQALGVGAQRQRSLMILARKIIQRDGPEAVVRWADAVPDDDPAFKLDVNRQVAGQLALSDPAVAVAWCERICDGPSGSMTRSLIAQRWAETDGRSAMEWAGTGPPGTETNFAVQGAFRGWLMREREGLMEWVDAMGPEGVESWFQPAIEGLAIMVARQDPHKGASWAAALRNEEARNRTYVTIARNWRKKDAESADAWIEEMGFSDEIRGRIDAVAYKRRGRTPAEMKEAIREMNAAKQAEAGEEASEDAGTESLPE